MKQYFVKYTIKRTVESCGIKRTEPEQRTKIFVTNDFNSEWQIFCSLAPIGDIKLLDVTPL